MSILLLTVAQLQFPHVVNNSCCPGIMETTVAEFLVALSASVFVIDCNPNMQGPQIADNAVVSLLSFVRDLAADSRGL